MAGRGREDVCLMPVAGRTRNVHHSCIKSKPAHLILLWNFAVLLVYKMFYDINAIMQVSQSSLGPIVLNMIMAFVAVFSPVAGFLTDVRFSRYKVVLCCSYTIIAELFLSGFVVMVIVCIGVVSKLVNQDNFGTARIPIYLTLAVLVGILMLICVVCLINTFQFGMDQLHDSSTEDLILYIHWYVWIYYTSVLITNIPMNLVFYDSNFINYIDATRISGFAISACVVLTIFSLLTASICVLRHTKAWFLLEPPGVKPYRLVYQVIRFAYQHKVPLKRSAFTYCEDELPSRLDLGKEKYGGPFSTKQVEDVKAFLGILKVILSMGPAFLLQTVVQSMLPPFARHDHTYIFTGNESHDHQVQIEGIARHIMVSNGLLSPLLVVVCVPVYLCLIRPRILYHIPGMLKRIGAGIVLIVISLLSDFVMDFVVHAKAEDVNCMFGGYGDFEGSKVTQLNDSTTFPEPLYQNPYFFISQYALSALVNMLIDIAVLEFICSQSPYSIKGFLFGLFFSTRSFFQALAIVSILPFTSWHINALSCGSGFYIMNIVIGVLELALFVFVSKKYVYRRVNEPSNEYRYAEEYYSNIQ